jgi:hypothetical protein
LNNLIEQDHRSIKLLLGPMLGLKRFRCASITIAGIELTHRIRKGQFKLGKLRIKDKTAPEIWNAVLAAWPDEFASKRKGGQAAVLLNKILALVEEEQTKLGLTSDEVSQQKEPRSGFVVTPAP